MALWYTHYRGLPLGVTCCYDALSRLPFLAKLKTMFVDVRIILFVLLEVQNDNLRKKEKRNS
jgi:hypothetical protein